MPERYAPGQQIYLLNESTPYYCLTVFCIRFYAEGAFFLFHFPAVVTNNDESHVLTPAKMSQRQGKEGYLTPTKEQFQPSLSPGTAHSHGKKHFV